MCKVRRCGSPREVTPAVVVARVEVVVRGQYLDAGDPRGTGSTARGSLHNTRTSPAINGVS
jgi:hypothetical protein